MGIDAEMYLDIPYDVTPDQIREWSYHLVSSLGSEKFFFSRKEGTFMGETFPIHGALSRVEEFLQDGPSIFPAPGHSLLRVHVCTRYYGPGYERGDILFLCSVAEWCEQNIKDCKVFYGGDSSGVIATEFSAEKRSELKTHLYTPDLGRAYYNENSSLRDETPFLPPTDDCQFCIPNHRPQRYGWGASYAAYYCRGCGTYFKTEDSGITWEKSLKDEGRF